MANVFLLFCRFTAGTDLGRSGCLISTIIVSSILTPAIYLAWPDGGMQTRTA